MKTAQLNPGALLLLGLSACSGSGGAAPAPLPGDSEILAIVDGAPLSRYDVELEIAERYGPAALEGFDDTARRNVLEGLIKRRAIALARERELGGLERAALERRVRAYRERQLVEQYLKTHAPAAPVTEEQIAEHYQAHPERFGASAIRTYELIASTRALTAPERAALAAALEAAPGRRDWPALTAELVQRGLPLDYRKGQATGNVLPPQLQKALESLRPGAAAPPTFLDGRAYLVRLVQESGRAPRPLAEVRAEIERELRQAEVKRSIAEAAEGVLSEIQVELR